MIGSVRALTGSLLSARHGSCGSRSSIILLGVPDARRWCIRAVGAQSWRVNPGDKEGPDMEQRERITGMESRAKLAGHAIHPMLIVFPLGLLAMAVIFDILYFALRNVNLASGSFLNISAGIITGLLAAV